ncbi:MAG: SnoaL-like polyketide cyclase [Thermoleophilaceae bacterium]|jgi:ketosteroid isomerase-like protein|nr:SnoaL-like polyketide cyclase [Thermoleophilaceae bacterium]
MSQANIDCVRRVYDALNLGGFTHAFSELSPDFELTLARGPIAGAHTGTEELENVWNDVIAGFDYLRIEIERILAEDDWVLAIVRREQRPQGSTASFSSVNGHLWRFRDGVAISMVNHPDPSTAFEAVGVSE